MNLPQVILSLSKDGRRRLLRMGRYQNPGLESRGMTIGRMAKDKTHTPRPSPRFHHTF